MNYREYRCWRDENIKAVNPQRLDCMNPSKALDFLLAHRGARGSSASADDVAAQLNFFQGNRPFLAGRGIRKLLEAYFLLRRGEDITIWIPEDVYPVYFDLAAGFRTKTFPTLTGFCLDFLDKTGTKDVVLLPVPLSPLGRYPDAGEIAVLQKWLRRYSDRRLLMDMAYCYEKKMPQSLADLAVNEQSVVFYSASKTYLLPQSFGVAWMSPSLRERMSSFLEKPEQETLSALIQQLKTDPDLPERQRALFHAEWRRLSTVIKKIDPLWTPPASGYFSVLNFSCDILLKRHRIMGVPASVFGSLREDISVITCLHDLRIFRAPSSLVRAG